MLRDFKLTGQINDQTAAFTLTATARVNNSKGGSLRLLSGNVALTGVEPHPNWRLRFDQGQFVIEFDQPGDFPIQLKFNATVTQSPESLPGWNAVGPALPQRAPAIVLQGSLRISTQLTARRVPADERRLSVSCRRTAW